MTLLWFRKFIGYRPLMRVLLLLILVTVIDTFNISSSSRSCDIDGQPVLWDGENVDMACSIDITGAFQLVVTKSSPAQNLFTYALPNTTTIQGDFTNRVINEFVAPTGVSFTVSSFTTTDSSPYICTQQNITGGYPTTIDLTDRIFTKPLSSSIPLTTKVDGTTVGDGDTIGQSSNATITLETSSVSGSPVPTLSITRDGKGVSCTQTSLTSTARTCQATISSTDLQSSSQIVTSAVLCDVSNSMTFPIGHHCTTCIILLVFIIILFAGMVVLVLAVLRELKKDKEEEDGCTEVLAICIGGPLVFAILFVTSGIIAVLCITLLVLCWNCLGIWIAGLVAFLISVLILILLSGLLCGCLMCLREL